MEFRGYYDHGIFFAFRDEIWLSKGKSLFLKLKTII